ncbi:MAG TPA: hypothetical protein PKI46_04260, partial [Bacteroidales bacterium]|nr:hypothetical protein [Bacteroidales bacterium]
MSAIITLEYDDTIEGIDKAIRSLKSRREELITYKNSLIVELSNIQNLIDFIENECELGDNYEINATTLRETFCDYFIRLYPDLEIPTGFHSSFGRMMTTFIYKYKEYGINRKHKGNGTSYTGITIKSMIRKSNPYIGKQFKQVAANISYEDVKKSPIVAANISYEDVKKSPIVAA